MGATKILDPIRWQEVLIFLIHEAGVLILGNGIPETKPLHRLGGGRVAPFVG